MKTLIEKEYYYASCKGADSTNYYRKQHQQCCRRIRFTQRKLQRYPQGLLEAEMGAPLGYEKNQKGDIVTDNKRNGHSPKPLKSQYGEFEIGVPRGRNGELEPKLIPKCQRDISGIEEKVISLYSRGMSARDIHDHLRRSCMGLNYLPK